MKTLKRQWTILQKLGDGELHINMAGLSVEFEVMNDHTGATEKLTVRISKIAESPGGYVLNFRGMTSVEGVSIPVLGSFAVHRGIGRIMEE